MNLANKITMLRILLIPVFVAVLYLPIENNKLVAAIVFLVIALTDFVDGYIARKYDMETKLGRMLDPLADKILVITAFVLLIGEGIPAWAGLIIVLRELIIAGVRGVSHLSKKTFKASFFAKLKTISQMIAVIVVLLELPYSIYFVYFAVVLSVYSGAEYFVKQKEIVREVFS